MLPAAAFDSMLSAGALGVDCAGVISRVGSAVTDVAPGDEVIALSPASLASHAITKDLVARKPAGLSFADAAALPLAYVTAIYALERIARLERGERVLIHAATGGVGLAALAVAERAGAEIFATAGSEAKRAYLRARGIRHVMDSRTLDFAGQIMSATGGRGVDVVLNSLAGDAIRAGLSVLAPRGRFLEIGKADIYRRGDLPLDAFRNNISFAAIQIDVLSDSNRALLRDLLREVTRGIEDGTLPPLPQQTVSVGSLADGLRTLAQARHIGKVVIDLDDATVPIESSAESRPLVRTDATYLITGGRGGVGLALARWAVERGARRLVLMSRSATAADGDPAIAAMRQRGAEVLLANGDVTKPADVEQTIAAADTPAALAQGRVPRRDGDGRLRVPGTRRTAAGDGAGAQARGWLEPSSRDAKPDARSLRPVLVDHLRLRQRPPGQLRRGECVSRRARGLSPRRGAAGARDQFRRLLRCRLCRRAPGAHRLPGAPGAERASGRARVRNDGAAAAARRRAGGGVPHRLARVGRLEPRRRRVAEVLAGGAGPIGARRGAAARVGPYPRSAAGMRRARTPHRDAAASVAIGGEDPWRLAGSRRRGGAPYRDGHGFADGGRARNSAPQRSRDRGAGRQAAQRHHGQRTRRHRAGAPRQKVVREKPAHAAQCARTSFSGRRPDAAGGRPPVGAARSGAASDSRGNAGA